MLINVADFGEKCETLPMSFQLTIQLPPGQCWKVIKQTDTKLRVHIFKHAKMKLPVQLYSVRDSAAITTNEKNLKLYIDVTLCINR